jgi:hypothetical protein
MKILAMICCIVALPWGIWAQEVYKWEDEKGVIHYGDKPAHPQATPLEKEKLPYSNTGSLPPDSIPDSQKERSRSRARSSTAKRQGRPSPSLVRPKAWLDETGRFRLSSGFRNGGQGLCWFPTVEVTVFDERGSVDGRFETGLEREITNGEEMEFEGRYFTPIGSKMKWDAVPRCGEMPNAVYGKSKHGTLSLDRTRTLRVKKFRVK